MSSDGQYTAVLVLWTLLLGVVVFVLVPTTLVWAGRLITAAKNIDTRMAVTLEAAGAVVGNTAPTRTLLDGTVRSASDVLATAGSIDAHAAAIEGVLAARAAGKRS